jgi:hypothetical protein
VAFSTAGAQGFCTLIIKADGTAYTDDTKKE